MSRRSDEKNCLVFTSVYVPGVRFLVLCAQGVRPEDAYSRWAYGGQSTTAGTELEARPRFVRIRLGEDGRSVTVVPVAMHEQLSSNKPGATPAAAAVRRREALRGPVSC
jgi:hypothetical protein